MEKTVVIHGLTRQTPFWGLPLPYFLAVGAIILFPFMWLKIIWWLFTAPLWYLIARIIVVINPNAHRVFAVVMIKTFPKIRGRKEGRRYVSE